MALRYFRARWEEDRGDEHSAWGHATYLFVTTASFAVERQVEVYDDGHVLAYDRDHVADEYGTLADQTVDLANPAVHEISADEFVQATADRTPNNR